MLKIPELAMPRSRKVTTVCNGKREVWTDYEQAKTCLLNTVHFPHKLMLLKQDLQLVVSVLIPTMRQDTQTELIY